MKLLDGYFKMQKEIYDYFGYEEDWMEMPLVNHSNYHWKLTYGKVLFGENREVIGSKRGGYWSSDRWSERQAPKVYKTKEYTMVCVEDPYGNRKLLIFDNEKEIT